MPTFRDRGRESAKLGAKAAVSRPRSPSSPPPSSPPPPPPMSFVPELGAANIIHQNEDQGQRASNKMKGRSTEATELLISALN